MPTLEKIVIQDFRNIVLQELEFSPNINCISGGNGEGKTNLLDAIWYLSMTKSAFSTGDRFSYRYGTTAFALSGAYRMEDGRMSRVTLSADDGGKKVRRDDKPYPKVSEHIGLLPIVMVSPADVAMVSESGEERRKFVNSVLSQIDREYLDNVLQYNRLLMQRNRLLKGRDPDSLLLDTFDERMRALAGPIQSRRDAFAAGLAPVVKEFYSRISGGREDVDIRYVPNAYEPDRSKEIALGFTSCGPQRDDFLFTMNGHPIRRCGSQGQQKSFLVALKFAQYEVMKQACGFPPMLLLDDLFDKLDMERVANLLRMVSGNDFGQIFITDSNKTRINGIVDAITSDRAYFETAGGVFTRIDE